MHLYIRYDEHVCGVTCKMMSMICIFAQFLGFDAGKVLPWGILSAFLYVSGLFSYVYEVWGKHV